MGGGGIAIFCLANISPRYDLKEGQNYNSLVPTNKNILCGLMNHTQVKSLKHILKSWKLLFLIQLEVILSALCTCLLYQTYLTWF